MSYYERPRAVFTGLSPCPVTVSAPFAAFDPSSWGKGHGRESVKGGGEGAMLQTDEEGMTLVNASTGSSTTRG
jgi:hypothetical protein